MQAQLINFSLPAPLLKALDTQAKREVKTRSEAIRDAIRGYLGERQRWGRIFSFGEERARDLKIVEKDVDPLVHAYRQGR